MTSAVVTSWVRALVAPWGSLAGRGSSHCPRRSLRLIAVATLVPLVCPAPPAMPAVRHLSRRCPAVPGSRVCGAAPGTPGTACGPRVRGLRCPLFAPLRECVPFDLQLQVAMLAWCGQSALYLAPEQYKMLLSSSKRGSKYPLYFRAVWPFGVHGGTFRWREEWARWGSWLRLWIGQWRHWGRFWFRFGPFCPAGPGVRSPWTGPRFGPGLFWCWFGGRLRCVAVNYAACLSLPLLWLVHTPKLVCVFL